MGSGRELNRVKKQNKELYGHHMFEKVILEYFYTEQQMFQREKEVVTVEYCRRSDTYNKATGGKGGFSKEDGIKGRRIIKQCLENDSEFKQRSNDNLIKSRSVFKEKKDTDPIFKQKMEAHWLNLSKTLKEKWDTDPLYRNSCIKNLKLAQEILSEYRADPDFCKMVSDCISHSLKEKFKNDPVYRHKIHLQSLKNSKISKQRFKDDPEYRQRLINLSDIGRKVMLEKRISDPEFDEKMRQAGLKGFKKIHEKYPKGSYHFFNNGIDNEIIIIDGDTPPLGWVKGKLSRKFINNGSITTTILSSETIPQGWVQGRLKHSVKLKYINNGTVEKKIPFNDPVPHGWFLGKISGQFRWINNGINQRKIKVNDPTPEGWINGTLKLT